jgi:hypothetical protein
MKNGLSPVVLFTYNRLWHTKKTIESLKKNHLASESILFIYSDAPKDKKDYESVKKIRHYIASIDGFKKISIILREQNFGLANSIIDGVTSIVKKYGKVIVLEDDLVTSPLFLDFMNDALELYKNNNEVMHISGSVYPIDNSMLDDTFFIKPASCWGWATWERAWVYYNKDPAYYLKVFDKKMIHDFNLNNSYKYFDQIKLNHKQKLNTWAIFWYASIYINNGLSLHPKESFVRNIGHDGLGENCDESSKYDVELSLKMPKKFTKDFVENQEAKSRFEDFFIRIREPLYRRVINRISREIFGKNLLKLKNI